MEIPGFINITDSLKGGVYILKHKGKIVYIGQSKCMLPRVYAHRSLSRRAPGSDVPKWLPIKGIQFDEILILPCSESTRDQVERELIGLYMPLHNVQHKGKWFTAEVPLKIKGVEIVINQKERKPQPVIGLDRRI